ncbi:hypothetical protein TEA_021205 [Camellia sinensis var. sinensis]|uniref:ADP/ATP translocase n=1 Tax=Camellia sinensis var. sinensis TaxID=542762 RepID=A0A4S4EZ43_CAMSN|nr:hypothetical protein TEA_021205 [Camellia sinensis var. sinensis]
MELRLTDEASIFDWIDRIELRLGDLYKNVLRSGNSQESHFVSGPSSNFIAGGAAGCTTLVIIYPLDIAHTRLASDLGRLEARQFQGISHFLSTIYKKDGIRGIYRGLPASLHGMVIHRSLYFGGFDTIKEMMSEESKPEVALWKRWVAAQAATTSAGLVSYPLDTVRRRIMMQSGLDLPMYRSTLDCWRKIYQTEGVASFYHGALSNAFRSIGAAAILVLYDEAGWRNQTCEFMSAVDWMLVPVGVIPRGPEPRIGGWHIARDS